MKSVYVYLREKRISNTSVGKKVYNEQKTKDLLKFIPNYNHGGELDYGGVIKLLEEGAEPNAQVLGKLMTNMASNATPRQKTITQNVLKYIKDNYNIEKYLNDLSQMSWTIPQSIFGSNDIPLDSLKWILENGYVGDINKLNTFDNSLLGFIVTSATRSSNDQKKAIDLVLQHGANINDPSFELDHISKKVIRDYLIQKGRTAK